MKPIFMPESDPAALDTRRRRLLFRATHRGTHENDLMLGGFVRAHLDGFTPTDLDSLESIIDLPDPELADWLSGRQPIPAEVNIPLLHRIRASIAQ
jgi:antitoxin CptB